MWHKLFDTIYLPPCDHIISTDERATRRTAEATQGPSCNSLERQMFSRSLPVCAQTIVRAIPPAALFDDTIIKRADLLEQPLIDIVDREIEGHMEPYKYGCRCQAGEQVRRRSIGA